MKIKVLTMAFTRTDLIRKSHVALKPHLPPGTEYFILDQHYPLPTYAENERWLRSHSMGTGCKLLDPGKNLGYHEGINWAIEHMDLDDDDVVLNFDPDAMIREGSDGWFGALHLAFTHDKSLAVVGLNNETIDRELVERGYFDEHIGDTVTLRFMHRPVVMSVIAWKAGFIRQVGGLKENTLHYGGVEAIMFPILCANQKRWAVLRDYWEDVSLWYQADPEYQEWKKKHGQEHSWTGDFESYLRHIGRIK